MFQPKSRYFSYLLAPTILLMICSIFSGCIVSGEDGAISKSNARTVPFEVKFESSQVSIEPNGSGLITVEIENQGTASDSYELSLSGVLNGWTALLLDTSSGNLESSIETKQVSPNGQVIETMKITVPVSGQADITVTANSKGGQGTAMGIIKIIVQEDPIRVETSNPSQRILAGGSAYYDVVIVNDQPQEDLIKITVDGGVTHHPSHLNSSWTYSYNVSNIPNPEVIIPAGGHVSINLTIRSPLKTEGSTNMVIVQVVAISQTTDQKFFSPEIRTAIQEISALSIANPPLKSGDSGSLFVYNLNLKNDGTTDIEVVGPYLKPSTGWNLLPPPTSVRITSGTHSEFQVTLSIPQNSKAGTHNTVIFFTIEGTGIEVLVNLTANVNQVRNLTVIATADILAGIPVDMGMIIPVDIDAKNLGNGDDKLTMEISDLPPGWTVVPTKISIGSGSNSSDPLDFQAEIDLMGYTDIKIEPLEGTTSTVLTIHLGAGQIAHIQLMITPAEGGQAGSSRFTIYWHRSPGVEDRLFLTTNLRASDLKVGNGKLPTEIHADEKAEVFVTVVNNFTRDARDIQVKLLVDGKLEDTVTISSLAPDTSKEVTLTFKPERDQRLLTIVVEQGANDPNDVESHYTIEVLEPGDGSEGLSLFWWGIVMVLIILVVMILLFLVMRSSKAKDEGEKIDEYQDLYGKPKPSKEKVEKKEVRKKVKKR